MGSLRPQRMRIVQLRHSVNHIVQVLLGHTAAVNGEAHHIGKPGLLLRGLQIILHGEVAQLRDPDTPNEGFANGVMPLIMVTAVVGIAAGSSGHRV